MPTKNGKAAAIVDFVGKHPGCSRDEILAALGAHTNNGLLSYAIKKKMVFRGGPRSMQRHYPTLDEACDNHERLIAEAEALSKMKALINHRQSNLRRRASRMAANPNLRKCYRQATAVDVQLPDGVMISPNVKVTIAPTPKGRFDPEPGFFRAITNDWRNRT